MDSPSLFTGVYLTNCIAALLLFLSLLHSLFRKNQKEYADRLFLLTLFLTLSGALLNIAATRIHGTDPEALPGRLFLWLSLFSDILFHTGGLLFTLYLSCQAGFEEQLKQRFRVFLTPLIADFAVMFLYYIVLSGSPPWVYYITTAFYYSYVLISFFMLWKLDRALVIMPVILLVVRIYFLSVLHEVNLSVLLITVFIIYVYYSLMWKSILIHLGFIVLSLGTIMTLIIANIVTSAAFVSYLKTIHDRNESHLSDVVIEMEHYRSFPWLMQYWIDNADRIASDTAGEYEKEFHEKYDERLISIPPEKLADMPERLQYFYAKTCYDRLAKEYQEEMQIHNLDDLYLVVPDGSSKALIIFDGETNQDGTYRIGQYLDMEEESKEWENYNSVISDPMPWTLGRYSDQDDFGFYKVILFGENGEEAFLCNSFRRREVYEHLDFISASRNRAVLFVIVIDLVILLFNYLMVMRPLAIISRAVKRYEENKDPDAVAADMSQIQSLNEIGGLAKEFSSLAIEMNRHTATVASLAGEKERISAELRLASNIQSSALPDVSTAFPDRKNFDIYASMKPAKEVGGDFYDFFLMDEDHLAFLIADVSDKGVPAALFMMSAKNLINHRAHENGTPGEILTAVNSQLCLKNEAMMFVTVWMGILDLSSGELTYASAGHESPAILTNDAPFKLYESESADIVMGLIPDTKYPDHHIRLSPNSFVFIYTDGVTDAQDPSENQYGPERVLSCLNRSKKDSPESIIREISNDIADFAKGAKQYDDITMLCVRYSGSGDPVVS